MGPFPILPTRSSLIHGLILSSKEKINSKENTSAQAFPVCKSLFVFSYFVVQPLFFSL